MKFGGNNKMMRRQSRCLTDFSKNLKAIRKSRKMKQEDVTNRLNELGVNLSRQAYNRYENNNAEPDFQTLMGLARVFHVDVNKLLGFVKEEQEEEKKLKEQEELEKQNKLEELKIQKGVTSNNASDEVEIAIFDLITSRDHLLGGTSIGLNEDFSIITFSFPEMECKDWTGRLKKYPPINIEFTKEQLSIIFKVVKKAWSITYPAYLLQVIRRINDEGSIESVLDELQGLPKKNKYDDKVKSIIDEDITNYEIKL